VVDCSAPDPELQMDAVRVVLDEIGAGDVPELLAFNKADVSPEAKRLAERHAGSVTISALTGEGIEGLLETLGDRLRAMLRVVELVVPYERGDVLAAVHREGEVLVETHDEFATTVRVRVDQVGAARFREFVVGDGVGE
jgi:GTP-binding protein HflX